MGGAEQRRVIDLRVQRRRRGLPSGRTLHLIDLENLAGGSAASSADIEIALDGYERLAPFGADDQRVVACGKRLVFPAKDRWPGALVRRARGIDGADRLLLDAADPADVAGRFDRVVVGSGDHIFTDLVLELDRQAVGVCVVSRPEALSSRLRAAAPVVWHLDARPRDDTHSSIMATRTANL